MLKKIYLLFLLSFLLSPLCAQELKVEKITWLENDNEAATKPQYDGNKQLCALLKVFIDDLPGIQFSSSYIIGKKNIQYANGYYNVYVVGNINSIELKHNDYLPTSINFKKDFNISIESGKTYGIYLKTSGIVQKKTQTVVFNMIPRTGTITVNGKDVQVNKGMAQMELQPGDYKYTAKSMYYTEKSGSFTVTDVSEVKVIPLKLKAIMGILDFKCNVPTAMLYVDNKQKGSSGMIEVPLGKHKIRVVAEDWKDYTQELIMKNEGITPLKVTLEPKPFIPVVITCKGQGNLTLYVDNKIVPDWKNDGSPVKIKQGKHLITVIRDTDKDFDTKEKVVRINQNIGKIHFEF